MSNDLRDPAWIRQALGDLGVGARDPRDVLISLLNSYLTTPVVVTATTAQLADVTHSINTSANKVAGYMVFNTTTGIPVWADGAADDSTWSGADGLVDHTPI